MNIISVVLLAVLGIGVITMGISVLPTRQQTIASRSMRVGLALLTLPMILFCGFGFLASFEGSDPSFVAFRIGYAVIGALFGCVALYLIFGHIKSSGHDHVH